MGLIPGLGRSPGGGHGSPLQHSCLENPMGRGAWWTTVHGSHRVRHDQATGGAHTHRKSLKSQRIFSCSWKNWGPGVPQKAPSGAVFSLCVCPCFHRRTRAADHPPVSRRQAGTVPLPEGGEHPGLSALVLTCDEGWSGLGDLDLACSNSFLFHIPRGFLP